MYAPYKRYKQTHVVRVSNVFGAFLFSAKALPPPPVGFNPFGLEVKGRKSKVFFRTSPHWRRGLSLRRGGSRGSSSHNHQLATAVDGALTPGASFGKLSQSLTQILTSHDGFDVFLHRTRRFSLPLCILSGGGMTEDNVTHTLVDCAALTKSGLLCSDR